MESKPPHHDLLTGFLSRFAFEGQFKALMTKSTDVDMPVSLAFLDIDNFLEVNENWGHSTGDQVIQGIAETIKEHLQPGAIPGRYGGDEFVILFPELEREQAFLILEQIRHAVENRGMARLNDKEIKVTVSAGVASYPIDGMTESEIFRKADQALYKAKAVGRNTIRLAYEERMATKTAHFTLTQLERLSKLAKEQGVGEAVLLREALDDLLLKYRD